MAFFIFKNIFCHKVEDYFLVFHPLVADKLLIKMLVMDFFVDVKKSSIKYGDKLN